MLVVHRSESADALVLGLAAVLAVPPADPFARDVVAVPAQGVERWIAQRLSHALGASPGGPPDGVCARVDMPRPGRVLDEAVAAVSEDHAAAVEAWSAGRSAWPLLAVLEEGGTPLDRALAEDGRRMAAVQQLARRLAAYGRARPAMLVDWAAGGCSDGADGEVPEDLRWQVDVWRALRERLGPSPAELLEGACARLRAEPDRVDLPDRLSVYGPTRLSPARLAVLGALAAHREVHLWLHHASPALWDAVAAAPAPRRRRDDVVRRSLREPLLGSLGRDLLELQQLLRLHGLAAPPPGGAGPAAPAPAAVEHRDEHLPPERELPGVGHADRTLLQRLQRALARDEVPVDPPPPAPGDRSVRLHSCHGRVRQVEVLREAVLGLLADDPTLEPRDVLVLCPDVEAFAPLVAAAFGAGSVEEGEDGAPRPGAAATGHPVRHLRVRVADRAPRRENPLLQVLAQVLDLVGSRVPATAVLDLAGHPAVRRRFRLDDDALERLRGWVVAAGVRWGLDADHRAGWGLGGLRQGTWRAGLDRLLLGVAVEGLPAAADPATTADVGGTGGADLVLGGAVPLDDVDSSDVALAGSLAELVDRLDAVVHLLAGRRDAASWAAALEDAVLGLAAPEPDGPWQAAQLHRELAGAAEGASDAVLGAADVRVLLADLLVGRPTRAGFRTGAMTVCTLVPMRSVPSRVVVLLGLDDGAFPRRSAVDGDDLLVRDPWTGEHDPRSEDRQLLLDAVAAAGDHLLVLVTGADERTGADVPPAVPVDELLDALDRTATVPGGRVRDVIRTTHPLQPFDARAFRTPAAGRAPGDPDDASSSGSPAPRPFSFDTGALAAARAAAGPRRPPRPVLAAPLPARPPVAEVSLADLRSFLLHPVRAFWRQRLEVSVVRPDEEPDDALPLDPDGLERWALAQRLLDRRVAGGDVADLLAVELHRGDLPPGPLGERYLRGVGGEVEAVVRASEAERALPPGAVDVDADLGPLPGGGPPVRVVGTVGGVRGDVALHLTASRLGPKHRLLAWLDLLALTAGAAGGSDVGGSGAAGSGAAGSGSGSGSGGSGGGATSSWRAVAVGRAGGDGGAARSVLGPLGVDDARTALAELVALHRAGLDEPLPLPLKTAEAYASRRRGGGSVLAAQDAAARRWDSDRFPGEAADPEHLLLHGRELPSAELWFPPTDAERGPGWAPDEPTRLGALARRVWDRLLDAEAGGTGAAA
ncbi:exodeoxyribonuclease V subunit gamma [uncultured Pseudokineococcus sp.]|uniref:exodeoxyribonuclease V subunit gamma n=1 Tax=uncultured Pseudokineococcus sp. TaxID=1642928 RepID=UPI002609A49C|nr:exodeoxyribonuclease V subunit gamma [uncultured Pseudokineococcus sp.]